MFPCIFLYLDPVLLIHPWTEHPPMMEKRNVS
uniref:Uncharacterized protein n=1 Tax=Lepeophtheirus salmonis TaxID=72036 RepID=A0A0K2UPF1_LEPSM